MAETQPSEDPTTAATAAVAGVATSDLPPSGPTTKRQRRPSVRLGDIGDPPASSIPHDPPLPRRSKLWKLPSDPKPHSRTRPLTTLSPSDDHDDDPHSLPHPHETLTLAIRKGLRDGKPRRGPSAASARRARSSWISKQVDAADAGVDLRSNGGDDTAGAGEDGFREDSENRDANAAMVDGDAPSESDGGDWNENRNGGFRLSEDGGVRLWLERLGLGRYAPVFEIHEVDDEVLPLLTLEDLKDMGINAVGSRRKMYCAIQKLRKSFT